MSPCHGAHCAYGFETVTNPEVGDISGAYRTFVEVLSFAFFSLGVGLNTGILTVLISAYPNLDTYDGFLMNLSFGELVSSFGLAFLFFVEFTTSIAPIGDAGCQFLTWLDVTSVTITVTSLTLITYALHSKIYYANLTLKRRKFVLFISLTWIVAAIPGMPYIATSKMENNFCTITHWSHDAEALYICALLLFQVMIPLAIIIFFFVRIFLALRLPREGDSILVEESIPGSEACFQRAVLKRKVLLVFFASIIYYTVLITVSIVELALTLNVNNIEDKPSKYARVREVNSLLLCLKCIGVPIIYIRYYDKLQNQFKSLCCCRGNQEIYNSLNLRYNVYQQTVHETTNEENLTGNRLSAEITMMNEESFETERDDIAILDNAA